MKKLFEGIGILSLICVSFLYTEKTVNVVKEYDEIMISIKEENENYKVDAKDATIIDDTIIPGIKGKEVNINSSYSQMKRYGKFNSNLLVYQEVLPEISISENLDKYIIGGNAEKNMISFIFLVEENDSIDTVLKILDEKDVKGNFFVDGKWLEKNNKILVTLIEQGHNIGNLSYNRDYTNSSYGWMDTFIKQVGKQKIGYCYNEIADLTALQLCALSNNYTIRPNIIVKNYPLKEIKEQVSAGSIISMPINKTVEKELPTIISFITSKGYKIENLENHLSESINMN